MKKTLIPAILAYTHNEFKEQLEFFDDYFSRVHIDIMDNTFVSNASYADVAMVKKMKSTATFELHLMVNDPLKYFQLWKSEKRLKNVIIHIEIFGKNKKDLYDIIKVIKRSKKRVTLALNPGTPISKILEFIHLIDQVLIMGVEPGWSGQKFKVSVLTKIKALKQHYPKLSVAIDGGVTLESIPALLDAGVDTVNTNSLIMKYKKLASRIPEIKKSVTDYGK